MKSLPVPYAALSALIEPRTVAVIGASDDVWKMGWRVAKNVANSKVTSYFVNKSGGQVLGQRAYRSLRELPEVPDAICLVVPAQASLDYLREAAGLGCKAGVLFSAGFRESDEAGRLLEQELVEIAGAHGLALQGPNCIGMANFASTKFLCSGELIGGTAGPTALISQSGSLALALSSRNKSRLRYMMSIGNEAIVHASDLLGHLLATDPDVRTFALILESIQDRDRFAQNAAAAIADSRRVVLLKASGNDTAGRAAALHTGSISGALAPLEAFCRDLGITVAKSLREFTAALDLLALKNYRGGNRLAMFTSSGGSCVLGSKYAEDHGLDLAQPDRNTQAVIGEGMQVPPDRVLNPFDTTGMFGMDAKRYAQALRRFADDENFDVVVVPIGGASEKNATSRMEGVLLAAKESRSPIIPIWQHRETFEQEAYRLLRDSDIPVFPDYEGLIEAMAMLSRVDPKRDRKPPSTMDAGGRPSEFAALLEDLRKAGVPIARLTKVRDAAQATELLASLGTPLALKVSHPALLHKSEAAMVVFPITDKAKLEREIERLGAAIAAMRLEGASIVAQAGVTGGFEMLVGLQRDVEMGAYVVVAAGGIYTEILKDSATVLIDPAANFAARLEAALGSLRVWPILAGARGHSGFDWRSAIQVIDGIARYFAGRSEITALEVNPLILLPGSGGSVVVDARSLLGAEPASS